MKSLHTIYQSRDSIEELDRNNSHSNNLLRTHQLLLLIGH